MPHGLTLDADDNMWITDVGLHQVCGADDSYIATDFVVPSIT